MHRRTDDLLRRYVRTVARTLHRARKPFWFQTVCVWNVWGWLVAIAQSFPHCAIGHDQWVRLCLQLAAASADDMRVHASVSVHTLVGV